MLKIKSKGTNNQILDIDDLKPKKLIFVDETVGFPDITIYRAGNTVQMVINGPTKNDIAKETRKEFPTPNELIPIINFASVVKNSADHSVTFEVTRQTIALIAKSALNANEWFGASVNYIGNIFGGGCLRQLKILSTIFKNYLTLA